MGAAALRVVFDCSTGPAPTHSKCQTALVTMLPGLSPSAHRCAEALIELFSFVIQGFPAMLKRCT
jgi:hypothetical protein